MLSNGRGQTYANHVVYRAILDGAEAAFNYVIAGLKDDTKNLSEWGSFDWETAKPQLIRLCDTPDNELQARYPAITITPQSGSIAYPMTNYDYTVAYTYASPKVMASQDAPMLGVAVAQEAIYRIFKESPLMTGIGWTFQNWTISAMQEANSPTPLYSRILTVDLIITVEEDY